MPAPILHYIFLGINVLTFFVYFLLLGKKVSREDPYGPYPYIVNPTDRPGKKVLVVQDYTYGKYLGYLKVTFDSNGEIIHHSGNPILLGMWLPEDQDVLKEVKKRKAAVDAYAKVNSVMEGEGFFHSKGNWGSLRSLNGSGNILHAISRGMNMPSRGMKIHLYCPASELILSSYPPVNLADFSNLEVSSNHPASVLCQD